MKTSELAPRGGARRPGPALLPPKTAGAGRRQRRSVRIGTDARQQQIEERIAAASEELASGITQAGSAAEQLRKAMEQIASGAEEAAGASQQTLMVTTSTAATLVQARDRADTARRRTEVLQGLLAETANEVGAWASNIRQNGERQAGSVSIIEQLSRQASSIGEVTETVSRVSDQTNLLALNAAIEAARAGDHGRGFAVVADEVRALAETSETSAGEALDLANRIQQQVQSVVSMIRQGAESATAEAEKGTGVIAALAELRKEVAALTDGSQAIAVAAVEAESASREAQKGAEIIASAAEEQAAAAAEALRGVEQQVTALTQSRAAAASLTRLAGDGRAASRAGDADQLASAAEQLSSAVQEISGAATQIMVAVEQIGRGAQQQAAATQEASAAIDQIEKNALVARENATNALKRARGIVEVLAQTRLRITELSEGVTRSLQTTRHGLELIDGLEEVNRSVEKIVDGIGLVSLQTNMLAVSGSVEAARAGELGRGFAVVSKDIRNLARDSGENAGRIKDIVSAIQKQISTVRRDLEQIIEAAEADNRKNAAVLASLDTVDRDMTQIAGGNEQLLTSADAILTSMKEAALGANQVAAVAEEAGSAAAEAAAAAKQQARGAEDLAAAIEEIAGLAEAIQRRNG